MIIAVIRSSWISYFDPILCMVELVYWLTSVLFVDIPSLCYINLNLSIICCLSFGDIYLSFGISVSLSTVSEVCCGDFL